MWQKYQYIGASRTSNFNETRTGPKDKVVWFEKSKEIILSRGNSKDEGVINMIEDLFDLLMVKNHFDAGKRQVVESFVPRICALIIDSRVNICIHQETIKKMNAMLDKMPPDARKILSNQEMLILMSNMGERILDAGDYDLQVGIVEALCRMTTEKQRRELACHWFSMDFIANAFKGIKDSEFETDCRIFLNLVNGMLGDKRRVFTFPCLSAFFDKYELQIPSDEKLEEFWIDFNLGSQTLSFYIAGDSDDHQWEAVTVPEEKVQIYSIEVRESKKLLTVIMKNTVKFSKREGKELLLYFDASLEITNVTQKIFGTNKYREFARKQSISVAKTSVHVLFDASGSQILVPESQASPLEEPINLKEKPNSQKEFAKPPKHIKNSTQGNRKSSQLEVITPSKRKMSEASMIVPGADRYTVRSPILLTNTLTPRRRIKSPLQMMSSAEKPGVSKTSENEVDNAASLKPRPSKGRNRGDDTDKYTKMAKVAEKTENKGTDFPNQTFNELQDIPDLQAVGKIDKPALPSVVDNTSGNKMQSKWACWMPVTNIKLCDNQRASASSGDTSNQDIVTNKKLTKQKSSSSISDDDSEEAGKVEYKKEVMQRHKTGRAEVAVCKRNNQPPDYQHPEQENIDNTKQSDWRIESETTFKSVLLNKRVEESLIYRKKYILSKDVTSAVRDKSPSPRKGAKSRRKSGKRLTSELNSSDLKPKKMREKSKGKGFTDAAESLINQINKRYKPKDNVKSTRKVKESAIDGGFSNKSDLQLSKEKVQKKSYRQLKTTFVNVTSECPLNDVYNFNLNGADEPIIKLGIQEFQATAREASVGNSIKLVGLKTQDELETPLKTKDKRTVTDHRKKNLFSDTDTEYRFDDSKTDISWLREPKSKPQLLDYSRNKTAKKQRRGKSRPPLERGQPRSKMTPGKNTTKKADETVPDGRTRLPRRAANTKKNYKDLSNSESESEQEVSYSLKEKLLEKEENIQPRSKTRKLSRKEPNAVSANLQKEAASKEWTLSPLPKDTRRGDSLDFSPVSLAGSSSSIEVMRCNIGIEKITEGDFTQDYDCVTKSVSPYPNTSSPESLNSDYEVGGPRESTKNSERNLLRARESFSPIPQSFVLESRSASPLSMSSEGRERVWHGAPRDSAHISGPTLHLNRKRMYMDDDVSDAYEAELEKEAKKRATLLARKQSKIEGANDHTDKVSESTSPLSTNDDFIPGKNQETGISGVDVYEQFNTEFKRKVNLRQKLIEYFNNHSWKTAQHHLKAMNHKIHEYRLKKLDKFHDSIIEELEKLEKDSQSLKELEKEFADFWEKLFQKFIVYQKNERERLRVLKASLDKNVFFNPDHEESICTSEMCFMKEKMNMLQARLLKEMQEEELLTVRRGLLSLFMAHETNVSM
uniref:Synaptonemal complex protein 2 n=2 Tax=Rousettus aegyptiacus TaxID=9407 RepID=A0A7J8DLI3_ROUAE|nr:synaptonemal complex protein 2 [Rousettus aegyptiacus]